MTNIYPRLEPLVPEKTSTSYRNDIVSNANHLENTPSTESPYHGIMYFVTSVAARKPSHHDISIFRLLFFTMNARLFSVGQRLGGMRFLNEVRPKRSLHAVCQPTMGQKKRRGKPFARVDSTRKKTTSLFNDKIKKSDFSCSSRFHQAISSRKHFSTTGCYGKLM